MNDDILPPDPREGRQDDLAVFLRIALIALIVLCLVGTVTPARVSHDVGQAVAVLLVALPLVRLVWLLVRWIQKGDRRFALALGGLLTVVASAAAVGFWT